jgi:hypothetical protein
MLFDFNTSQHNTQINGSKNAPASVVLVLNSVVVVQVDSYYQIVTFDRVVAVQMEVDCY